MAVIKCKMCGGDIAISDDNTFGTCEYCGSTMTLPKVSDEQRAAAFNRGNHFRRMGEFDKALAVYERIVAEDDNDAEAHWCCALCRFGIEYVEDPATYEWLPTCHRASFDSFLEDVDYLAALEHSDGITRRQYQKDAAKIAEVQRGILATSQNEQPFDIFICYKESDDSGNRTVDSTLAQDIYYQLTDKGYRVFFSRITLEDKAGTEYEPYIFAALNSARVMIAVGTKPEYYNAVWVKNEWSRFLALMRKDRAKLLLPCYRDMDPYDLPEQLSVLQSYDMGKIGFIQDLIRGVAKVLDAEKKAPAPVKEKVVIQQSSGGVNLTAQLKRGQQALEDRDWKKADDFFDRALDIDAECAEAFWGKALAEARCVSGEDFVQERIELQPDKSDVEHLAACESDMKRIENAVQKYAVPGYLDEQAIRDIFSYDERIYASMTKAWQGRIKKEMEFWESDRLVSRAVRFAKSDFDRFLHQTRERVFAGLQGKLHDSEKADTNAAEQVAQRYFEQLSAAEREVAELHEGALSNRRACYDELCRSQAQAKTAEDYDSIAERFIKANLSGFEDCDTRVQECRLSAEGARERQKADHDKVERRNAAKRKKLFLICAPVVFAIIVISVLVTKVIVPEAQYKKAEKLLKNGDFDESISVFSGLGTYRDSDRRILEAEYQKADSMIQSGLYDEAIALLATIKDYDTTIIKGKSREAHYLKAEKLFSEKNYSEAYLEYNRASYFRDSSNKMEIVQKTCYEEGKNALATHKFSEALELFSVAGNSYLDCADYILYCEIKTIGFSDFVNLTQLNEQVKQMNNESLREDLYTTSVLNKLNKIKGKWTLAKGRYWETSAFDIVCEDGYITYLGGKRQIQYYNNEVSFDRDSVSDTRFTKITQIKDDSFWEEDVDYDSTTINKSYLYERVAE